MNEVKADNPPSRQISLVVDGVQHSITIEDRELLVDVIRDRLGVKAPKVGCYAGDCGACSVELNDEVVKSCLVLAASQDGAEVTTLAGVVSSGESLDPIQQAFWDHDAFQCGFCVAGFVFSARDLLRRSPDPTEEEIRESLVGNYCRCTGYMNYVAAIKDAGERLRSQD